MSKIKISEKIITKEEAEELIDVHTNYRKINQKRVDLYARAMVHEKWEISILLLDENGVLIDGQHRLAAVLKCGIPQRFAIVFGWPASSRATIDNNMVRTRNQVAFAERGAKDARNVMAVACSIESPLICEHMLNIDALEMYDKYREVSEEVISATRGSRLKAAIHCKAFAKSIVARPERKEEILCAIRKIVAMDFSEPRMYGLRNYYKWVIGGGGKGGACERKTAYLRCARAIEAYLNNEKLDKLFAASEDPFTIKPEII